MARVGGRLRRPDRPGAGALACGRVAEVAIAVTPVESAPMPLSPEKLGRMRRRARLNLAALARRAGTTAGLVGELEEGKRLQNLSLALVERLAAACGCKVDDLLDPVVDEQTNPGG